MIVVGIDPGKDGVICALDVAERTASYLDIPYREDGIINGFMIERVFEGFASAHKILIEKVQGRGGWGATQCFNFGKNYGMLLGLLHHVPLHHVQPNAWQKSIHKGVKGATAKDRSKSVFRSLNPSFRDIKKTDSGLIDAFLIARYGLEQSRVVFSDDWNFINLEDNYYAETRTL